MSRSGDALQHRQDTSTGERTIGALDEPTNPRPRPVRSSYCGQVAECECSTRRITFGTCETRPSSHRSGHATTTPPRANPIRGLQNGAVRAISRRFVALVGSYAVGLACLI
jgi:hypothetical protein